MVHTKKIKNRFFYALLLSCTFFGFSQDKSIDKLLEELKKVLPTIPILEDTKLSWAYTFQL